MTNVFKYTKTVMNTGSKQQVSVTKTWIGNRYLTTTNVLTEEEVGLDYLMYHKDHGFFDHYVEEISEEEYEELIKSKMEGTINNSGKPLFTPMIYKK